MEAHTELARIVIDDAIVTLIGVRIASGMKLNQSGPLADARLRLALRAKYSKPIEEARAHAERALEIDASADGAMKQMAGVFLVRGTLSETDSEFTADMKRSEEWQRKEVAVRASKQAKNPPNLAGGVIGGIIGAIPTQAPPPKQ